MSTVHVIWAQYHDRSNEPVLIAAFESPGLAEATLEMIKAAEPGMHVQITPVALKG
jgi:hypothetical protein